jgi:hypothetical protein
LTALFGILHAAQNRATFTPALILFSAGKLSHTEFDGLHDPFTAMVIPERPGQLGHSTITLWLQIILHSDGLQVDDALVERLKLWDSLIT